MKKYIIFVISFVISFPVIVYGNSLTLCYDIKALFLTVGKSCIHYKIDNQTIYFNSEIRSSPMVSWVSRINDYGKSIGNINTLKTEYFLFHQEEGNFKASQEYFFEGNNVKVKSIKYNNDWTIKDEKVSIYKDIGEYREPFMLSIIFYKNIFFDKLNILHLFYKGKTYDIPFKSHSEQAINVLNRKFETKKISFTPNIKGKGLLIPSGEWFIYIDKNRSFPIKIETKFIFINANLIISKIEGDEYLIKSIIKNSSK